MECIASNQLVPRPHFAEAAFSKAFVGGKYLYCDTDLQVRLSQLTMGDFCNDFSPNRRQAIICSDNDPVVIMTLIDMCWIIIKLRCVNVLIP